MAQAGEDLISVLAELGRRAIFRGLWRLGETDRLTDHLDVSERGMAHSFGDTEMLHLWLGEGLVNGIDRPAGDARVVQQLHPMRARLRLGDIGNARAQRF